MRLFRRLTLSKHPTGARVPDLLLRLQTTLADTYHLERELGRGHGRQERKLCPRDGPFVDVDGLRPAR
jgi:hypothetical protein